MQEKDEDNINVANSSDGRYTSDYY